MAISVLIYGDGYQVAVSPPVGPFWKSSDALSATEVLEKLAQLGCHSTDITDALSAADPKWAARHNEEALRQRRKILRSTEPHLIEDPLLLSTSSDRDELYRTAKERTRELGIAWDKIEESNLRLDVVHVKEGSDTYRLWLNRRPAN